MGHSVSPAMQNAALARHPGSGVYVAFDVHPDELRVALEGLEALGVRGVNVTIPHKQGILPLLDKLSPEAELIGAVNTVEFRDGRRWGHNTDAPGFLAALRANGIDPSGKRAVVLGAGGSARAVGVALAQEGTRIDIANRTESKADELAEHLNQRINPGIARSVRLNSPELRQALREVDLVVNTTPVGMAPNADVAPPAPGEWLSADCFVYDLIYNPLETSLMKAARQAGARAANGAGMLACQGALSMEIWTGEAIPQETRDLMESVVRDSLA